MIGQSNPSLNLLTDIYSANNSAIFAAMTRIASGKRVQRPGDDFAGYVHAQAMQSEVDSYQTIKLNLQDAKGLADYATGVGNDIAVDFIRLKQLKGSYAASSSDTDQQSAYKSQYDAVILSITDLKTASYFNGVRVYQTGATLQSVEVNPDNSALAIHVAATRIANESAVSDIANTSDAAIQNEINNAQTYAAELQSFGHLIQRTMDLVDTAMSSKQAAISVIMDVDDAQESAKLTVLQIRQKAAVSMMAQANIIQGYAAKLFGGASPGTTD